MVQELLRHVRTAVQNENRERVVDLTPELLDAFERNRTKVRAQASLARTARASAPGTTDIVESVQNVLRTASKTNQTKINVDKNLLSYIRGDDPDNLEEALTTAIETHNRFDNNFTKLTTQLEDSDVDVPSSVTIVSPNQFIVPKGANVEGQVTVRNDSTRVVENIDLSLESTAPLTLSQSEIKRIPSGDTTTVGFSGTPSGGEYQPEITATVDNRSDSATPYLLVQNKRTYLEQAIDELINLYNDLAVAAARIDSPGNSRNDGSGGENSSNRRSDEDSSNETLGGNDTVLPSGIENKTRLIAKRTLTIINRIEGSQSTKSDDDQDSDSIQMEAINNQIGSVINEVEALQNQIAALEGKKLYAEAGPQLQRDAGALIDIYEDAQEAAP